MNHDFGFMNHDFGFIIGIANAFFKPLIECTPEISFIKHPSAQMYICDPLSENPHSLHNFQFFNLFSQCYLQCLRSGHLKFQLN